MAAVTDQGLDSFSSFHFEPAQFDALLTSHGTTARVRKSMRCGCWDATTGQPDPACRLCYPFGYVYDSPVEVQVFGPNRKPTRRVDAQGQYDATDAFFTFPTGVVPPLYSRFTLPLSIITVDDVLTKGSEDVIRYGHVVSVEKAHYVTRTPASGFPYANTSVPIIEGTDYELTTTYSPGVDLDVARKVEWVVTDEQDPAFIPDGTRYVLRMQVFSEWVVWEWQDRNENGVALPFRAHCKQIDFLLHPRGDVTPPLTY